MGLCNGTSDEPTPVVRLDFPYRLTGSAVVLPVRVTESRPTVTHSAGAAYGRDIWLADRLRDLGAVNSTAMSVRGDCASQF